MLKVPFDDAKIFEIEAPNVEQAREQAFLMAFNMDLRNGYVSEDINILKYKSAEHQNLYNWIDVYEKV